MLLKISKDDWQFFLPFLACVICFITTDFLGFFDKTSVAYWSGRLFAEPYRAITSHFFHSDINHLLANSSGIIIARYFLKALGLRGIYFFIMITAVLMPIQSLLSCLMDIVIFNNPMSLSIGFSGVLYGVNAFILMATIYGKQRFITLNCQLESDPKLLKSICLITGIGIVWSFMPGVSLLGHMSGFLAGLLIFYI